MRYLGQLVALPNTVRHHGVHIPRGTIVRTMRGQRTPRVNSEDWIEYVPAPVGFVRPTIADLARPALADLARVFTYDVN